MLFIIGMIFLIFALIFIFWNKPKEQNIFDAILDNGEKYVDNITVGPHIPFIPKSTKIKDIPVIIGDDYKGTLECPQSLGKGGMKNEKRCRSILEKIYKKDFPTVRPNWLKNPATKRNLEIDCYNHELRLGLEYSPDSTHYAMGSFHKTKESLIYQMRKDAWKRKRCKELGITLIVIPSWATSNLKGYIVNKLRDAGKLPDGFDISQLQN